MRYNVLLGATVNHEIVFGEFEIRNRNGKPNEFSASFDVVRPFDGDSVDVVEYWEDEIPYLDSDTLCAMLRNYDCTISDLAENLAYDLSIEGTFDCSLYAECYTVDGADWYFESVCCGQHDTREEMAEYVNESAYNRLYELWDTCHLKEVGEDVVAEVESLVDTLSQTNEEGWITNYIHRHINELH